MGKAFPLLSLTQKTKIADKNKRFKIQDKIMLYISDNPVEIEVKKYQSFRKIALAKSHVIFRRFLVFMLVLLLIILFLPWTQNIRSKGKITTLSPSQRPQTIQSTIAGRIEKWYVREGQRVRKGDTILFLSEIKSDYFDPRLLERTADQVAAKQGTLGSYKAKASALEQQKIQTRRELVFKKEQLQGKITQTQAKLAGEKQELRAAVLDVQNEQDQLERTEKMFKSGLKSLTELENKRLKWQQALAKKTIVENKIEQTAQEVENLGVQLSGADSEYAAKISKVESDRLASISDGFDTEEKISKLEGQYANYAERAKFYYICAPTDCYITQSRVMGIGETVKEGQAVVTIVPVQLDLAVEIEIEPLDFPLVRIGMPMRFIFDGWPSFIFSGWPNASVGTYSGRVWAIDNVANARGKYRLLIAPDTTATPWPEALRPGSGAQGFGLLSDVPIWYELWRQLNGFPPDFYKSVSNLGANPVLEENSKEEKK
jgi:membrane fusion protein, adhesin transport system